ncbi:MAG: AraC family transcriptional regulator [Bacteroidetes bacterium]|nr:AraC family transcriptional regulator [Bacteroidota bacterium]
MADQLGFEDPSILSKFFKKHTGQSPQEFRNNFK